MNLFDSSALLALILGESGSEVVEHELKQPSACSTVNWSEVAQKLSDRLGSWTEERTLLLDYGIQVEPVLMTDAERAAGLWFATPSLSLGDRLCLATAERLDATVWTADQAWGESERIRQIR